MLMEIKRGERAELRLPGLGTAGYRWQFEVHGEPDVVAVTIDLAQSHEEGSRNAGSSVDEIGTITGSHVGTTKVRFFQRRSWEPATEPHNEYVVEVRVVE
jgi:predicted secreted protein